MENRTTALKDLVGKYSIFKEHKIEGRYLTYSHIKPLLELMGNNLKVKEIGISHEKIPIHTVTLGEGKIKILAWSQMHGNESTTTKAIFDLLKAVQLFPEDPLIKLILNKITLRIIPMLNPDGASAYTRENANKTDLNRDALRLQEPESKLLRSVFIDFDPHYCLNLHDQRTIFSAGNAPFPATLSFLTPAMDEKRQLFPERITSMEIIAAIASDLREWLPNGIGRYSDEFNPNCTGDTFQSLGKPTILFEAGHYPGDYQREISRKFVTIALLSALCQIASPGKKRDYKEYFEIPENNKLFYDLILRNAVIDEKVVDIAIQFKEVLENDTINFYPSIEKIKNLPGFYGHREIPCENKKVTIEGGKSPRENVIVKNIYLNHVVLAINYQNI